MAVLTTNPYDPTMMTTMPGAPPAGITTTPATALGGAAPTVTPEQAATPPAPPPTTPAPMDKETARRILSGAQAGDTKAAQEAYYGTNGLGGAYGQATGNAAITNPNQEQALKAHEVLHGGGIVSDAQRAAAQGTMDAWYAANPLFEKDVQGTYTGGGGKDPYAMNSQQWGTETAQDYALQQIKRLLGDKFDPATMKFDSVGPAANSPYQWQPQRTVNINGQQMNVGEIAKWYQGRDRTTADAMLRAELQGAGLMQGMDQYGNAGGTPTYTGQAPASGSWTQNHTIPPPQQTGQSQGGQQPPSFNYPRPQQQQFGFGQQQGGQYGYPGNSFYGQPQGWGGMNSWMNMGGQGYNPWGQQGGQMSQQQRPQQQYSVGQNSQLGYTSWTPQGNTQMNFMGFGGSGQGRNPWGGGYNGMYGGQGYGGGMYGGGFGGNRGGGMMGGQGYSSNTPYINNAMFSRPQGQRMPSW
jgi:hypothetical protein